MILLKSVKCYFFSDMIMIFFECFLIIFKAIKLDKVSNGFPDFETTTNKTLLNLFVFLKFTIFSSFKSLKKQLFF